MIKTYLLVLANLLIAQLCYSQLPDDLNESKVAKSYRLSKPDTNQIRLLLKWSSLLVKKPSNRRHHLDSALMLANRATRLGSELHFKGGYEDAVFLIGSVFIKTNRQSSLDSLLRKLSITHVRMKLLIARNEFMAFDTELGRSKVDSLFKEANDILEECKKLRMTSLVVSSMMQVAGLYYVKDDFEKGRNLYYDALSYCNENNYEEGKAEIFSSLNEYLQISGSESLLKEVQRYREKLMGEYSSLHDDLEIYQVQLLLSKITRNICFVHIYKGGLDEALRLSLETVQLFEEHGGKIRVPLLLGVIGKIYLQSDRVKQGIEYLEQASLVHKINHELLSTSIIMDMARAYIQLGQSLKALHFLEQNVNEDEYFYLYDKANVNQIWGDCYFALKKYALAEKHYMKSFLLGPSIDKTSEAQFSIPLGKLYLRIGQFDKAKTYLNNIFKLDLHIVPIWVQRDVHQMLFMADSATSDYSSAITHLNKYRILNDSIFNISKNKQIEELKLRYETDKKDHDLQLKEQDIKILSQQAQLRDTLLQNAEFMRDVFLAGGAVLILLLIIIYSRYRFKQNSNRLLDLRQVGINQSNENLVQINGQLQKVLIEKEWLVREIHHRVKNNLQIIVSLLNTQAGYLTEVDSLNAIRESQRRMEVISLLHQKMYKMDTTNFVNMCEYIPELMDIIRNGYTAINHIYFEVNIESVRLDISQAVPVGLILNEAITNSLKYAFVNRTNGVVAVSLEVESSDLVLRISDNGTGMLQNDAGEWGSSMGMKLIQTLVEQLDGELAIETTDGVTISVRFKPAPDYPMAVETIMNEVKK